MKKLLAILVLAMSFSAMAFALDLGDPAPALDVEKWVVGTEATPDKPDGKTIYVVEVWSVTCPPCVRSIPILNELQERYADKGVKIVSFTTDDLADVEPFLKENPIRYSSFLDKEGGTFIKYMAADNRNTIPTAFVFDPSGGLVWIGNPLDNLEGIIEDVVSGKLNVELARKIRTARSDFQAAMEAQDVTAALEALGKLHETQPDNPQYHMLRLRILVSGGGEDQIPLALKDWLDTSKDNAQGLATLADVAIEQLPMPLRNPSLALEAATRAYELAPTEPQIIVALAEAYRLTGRIDLSTALLEKAIGAASDDNAKEFLTQLLDYHKQSLEAGKSVK